jgi:hypothetical protein
MTTTIDDRLGTAAGFAFKVACRAATTANITLSGLQTIDGKTLVEGDRVLVRGQTNTVQNGIYVASVNTWVRAQDFNSNRDVTQGCMVLVLDGDTYGNVLFEVISSGTLVDTDPIIFLPFFDDKKFGRVSFLEYGGKPDDAAFDNGEKLQDALDDLAGTGVQLYVPAGKWYFKTGFTLTQDNWVIGASHRSTEFIMTDSAFYLIKQKSTRHLESGIANFSISGFSVSNTASVAVQYPETALVGSNGIGASAITHNIRFNDGLYRGIEVIAETDCFVVSQCSSFANFGDGWLIGEVPDNNSASAAAGSISGNHIGGSNSKLYGRNKRGIRLAGFEVPDVAQNIINGFDICIDLEDNSSYRATNPITIRNLHTEDFRPFINDPLQRANSTAYVVGNERFVGTFVYTVLSITGGGVTAASPPTFTTTIGGTTVDGQVTWQCVSRYSARWVANRVYQLGELVKPESSFTGYHAVWEVTVPGLGGASQPAWTDQYDDTVTDGAATLKLTTKSTALHINGAQSSRVRVELNGHKSNNHLTLYSIQGRVNLSVEKSFCEATGQGDTRAYFYCYPLAANCYAEFKNCTARGNIRPYNVANTDTFVCTTVLDHTLVVNDNIGAVATDGLGVYAAFRSETTRDNKSRSVGTDFSLLPASDEYVVVTGAAIATIPAASPLYRGREFVIYADTSSGVTVNFPAPVSYGGVSVSSFFLPKITGSIRFQVSPGGTGWRVHYVGPTFKARLADNKAAGTDGGTFTNGAWQTRTLNFESDVGDFVTLASNQMTLQPGFYRLRATAPGYACGRHQLRIRNITDGTTASGGTSAVSPAGTTTISEVQCFLTLTAATTFEVQHQCQTTVAANGFGLAANFGEQETYAQVELERFF